MEQLSAEQARIERLRAAIDRRLEELLPPCEGALRPLYEAMRYALLSPGKRLRPVLTMLTAWRLGADEMAALDPACAVEMVHAASLILDDLPCMDDTAMRRGAAATHVHFGEALAVLAGVGLLNQAYAVLAETPGLAPAARVEMVRAMTAAVGVDGLVAGQVRDLNGDHSLTLDGMIDLNRQKTGVLFLAAVQLGAVVADAPDADTAALARFATELGLAFQAVDDVADGVDPEEDAGRSTVLSLLGPDGARREASQRLAAAKSALDRGGTTLAALTPYVDALLQVA